MNTLDSVTALEHCPAHAYLECSHSPSIHGQACTNKPQLSYVQDESPVEKVGSCCEGPWRTAMGGWARTLTPVGRCSGVVAGGAHEFLPCTKCRRFAPNRKIAWRCVLRCMTLLYHRVPSTAKQTLRWPLMSYTWACRMRPGIGLNIWSSTISSTVCVR